jgi:thioredoxin 2
MADVVMVECPACGATNRVPTDRLRARLEPVCGKCREPLPVGKPQPDVERSPLPVLVDAWAPWCGPCHMIAPVIEQLATELAGRVRVVKLNVDDNPRTAARFNLRSIPTLLVLKDGREVDRLVGVQPKQEIARRLEQAIA